jgi:hypothetical protein
MLIVIGEVHDIYVHYICKECKGKQWNSIMKATKPIKIMYLVFCGNRSCFDQHIKWVGIPVHCPVYPAVARAIMI